MSWLKSKLPITGILARSGMAMLGKPSTVPPTKGAPTSPDKPDPKMVRARPVATWLVARLKANRENTAAVIAPATAPARMPIYGFPRIDVAAKADTAPISIMPSTPRFNTPLRSATNSPVAAKINGTDVNRTVRIKASILLLL